MKRPSFQFYPADWRGNAKLRRCSESARGAWVDLMCVFHDSDEYGVLRWPLADLARSAGVSLKSAQELHRKDVLKGSDGPIKDFIFTPRHAGRDGESVVLIRACTGPCWFSSRMVTDEWVRLQRGTNTRFIVTPKAAPKIPIGRGFGDGPTSSSSSSSSFIPAEADALKWLVNWRKNGADYTEAETKSAFLALSANGWMWGKNPVTDHRAALERQIQTDRTHQNYGKDTTRNHSQISTSRNANNLNSKRVGQYDGVGKVL